MSQGMPIHPLIHYFLTRTRIFMLAELSKRFWMGRDRDKVTVKSKHVLPIGTPMLSNSVAVPADLISALKQSFKVLRMHMQLRPDLELGGGGCIHYFV